MITKFLHNFFYIIFESKKKKQSGASLKQQKKQSQQSRAMIDSHKAQFAKNCRYIITHNQHIPITRSHHIHYLMRDLDINFV